MKHFVKENLVLMVGITLPLLLTVIFFIATQFDRSVTDPPRHSVVYASNYYAHNNMKAPYRLIVKDSTLHFKYTPPKDDDKRHWQKPRLFVFDPVANESKEIELPAIDDPEEKVDIIISELTGQNMNTLKTSPDGYTFEYNYRGNGNLMTELFGGGYRSRTQYVLRKGASSVKVPNAIRYNAQFIAWIVNTPEGAHAQ
jgi:hypothetical protein